MDVISRTSTRNGFVVLRVRWSPHPELGSYWIRALKAAEKVYQEYLVDVSPTRVSLRPGTVLPTTEIECRMENKIKSILMTAVPPAVGHQCLWMQDFSSSQVLSRTMVISAPASKDDRRHMLDMMTTPKSLEVHRLHDHLVMWQFARTRYAKYGFSEPEATILSDTLRRSCTGLEQRGE